MTKPHTHERPEQAPLRNTGLRKQTSMRWNNQLVAISQFAEPNMERARIEVLKSNHNPKCLAHYGPPASQRADDLQGVLKLGPSLFGRPISISAMLIERTPLPSPPL